MEWMLQVADEIDDAIATFRQWWLGAAGAVIRRPLKVPAARYNTP
jgi:hypothetical protein